MQMIFATFPVSFNFLEDSAAAAAKNEYFVILSIVKSIFNSLSEKIYL